MELLYKKTQATNVFMVELVYSINNKIRMCQMEECELGWRTEIKLPDGEYPYKFIVNNGIRINDPNAYRYIKWLNGETWSLLKIKNGETWANGYRRVELKNFRINSSSLGYGYKTIMYPKDSRCHVGFDLNNVCGVHSVSALWYQPDGSLYHIEEATIDSDANMITDYAESFWVNLNQNVHPFKYGIWMIEIYVDGEKQIREYFNVSETKTFAKVINYTL